MPPPRPVPAPYSGAEAEQETTGENRVTWTYQDGGLPPQQVVPAPTAQPPSAVTPLTVPLMGEPGAPPAAHPEQPPTH